MKPLASLGRLAACAAYSAVASAKARSRMEVARKFCTADSLACPILNLIKMTCRFSGTAEIFFRRGICRRNDKMTKLEPRIAPAFAGLRRGRRMARISREALWSAALPCPAVAFWRSRFGAQEADLRPPIAEMQATRLPLQGHAGSAHFSDKAELERYFSVVIDADLFAYPPDVCPQHN